MLNYEKCESIWLICLHFYLKPHQGMSSLGYWGVVFLVSWQFGLQPWSELLLTQREKLKGWKVKKLQKDLNQLECGSYIKWKRWHICIAFKVRLEKGPFQTTFSIFLMYKTKRLPHICSGWRWDLKSYLVILKTNSINCFEFISC